jgi:hypothetical protein
MQFQYLAALITLLATAQASSVCDYYGKDCGAPCNAEFVGATPRYCTCPPSPTRVLSSPCSSCSIKCHRSLTIVRDVGNTQQGASLGYTLDSACSLTFFSDNNCQRASQNFGSATKGCHDFSGTGGSWQFHC